MYVWIIEQCDGEGWVPRKGCSCNLTRVDARRKLATLQSWGGSIKYRVVKYISTKIGKAEQNERNTT